jgi:hypothetical protein
MVEERVDRPDCRIPDPFDTPAARQSGHLVGICRRSHGGDVDHVAKPPQRLMAPRVNCE